MPALAVAPLRRRALERKGMTPEEELELLIREQKADDTYQVSRPDGEISLDTPADGYVGVTLANLFGVDSEGNLEIFYRSSSRGSFDTQRSQHGTIYGYRRLSCRCDKCRAAQALSVREYRHRKNG